MPPSSVLHALSGGDHRVTVGDVGFDRDGPVAELAGESLDAIGTAGEQCETMSVSGQGASGRLADAR